MTKDAWSHVEEMAVRVNQECLRGTSEAEISSGVTKCRGLWPTTMLQDGKASDQRSHYSGING